MDDSRELTLKDILDSLNTPDPTIIDRKKLLNKIYKYHEAHPRYHYRDISNYVIEQGNLEEIDVISENLKGLMKWMEERSKGILCPLSIRECDMVRSLSKADILSCQCPTLRIIDVLPGSGLTCNQFKETYHVIYDHVQLEYVRSVLIQDHSEKLERQYKDVEDSIGKKINNLNDKERDLYLQIVTILGVLGLKFYFFNYKIVLHSALSGLLMFLLFLTIKFFGDRIFKKESLGGGDIKLAILLGVVLNIELGLAAFILSAFIAFPYALFASIIKKEAIVPYGPFIIASLVIVFSFEQQFMQLIEYLFYI